ncbi:hypothetical protein FH607_006380 [Streptomyces mimosae]|uniref:Uncharacterized protein n=2 Tax=Streptomyces mimosae TaxID=2586635 RepID=A0A5N6AL42_9ACTN|nr:hypothetical protein [Streptomyces sp. 3MP-14]KAB8168842.1 hypothetical protein FH607_006380 [Streptomyces mimosae]
MYAYFDVPVAFDPVPVGLSPEESVEHIVARRERAGVAGTTDDTTRQATQLHALSRTLRSLGTLFSGVAVGTIDGSYSMATLQVAASELTYGDSAETAAEGAMQSVVAARGAGWTGAVYPLPCGQPAAVVMGRRVYQLSGADPSAVPFSELQAFVPVPDDPSLPRQAMLTVSFSTPAAAHWETYMPLVTGLLRSLTFSATPENGDGDGGAGA